MVVSSWTSVGSGVSDPSVTRLNNLCAWSGETQDLSCGEGVSTTMSDNDDAGTLLGTSETARVHHPEGPPIPELFQCTEDSCVVSPFVETEQSGRVLKDHPSCASFVDKSQVFVDESVEFPEKSRVVSCESLASALSDGEVLARESSANNVGCSQV